MMNIFFISLFLLIDAGLILTAFACIRSKQWNVPTYYLIFPIFLPILGSLFLFLLQRQLATTRPKQSKKIDNDLIDLYVNKEKRNAGIREADEKEDFLSIEETLLLGKKKESRNLLMKLAAENPSDCLDLLFLARHSEDHETAHYATTMIAEVSRQYEKQLSDFERQFSDKQQDLEFLDAYADFMEDYLSKDLLSRQMARLLRRDFRNLLLARLSLTEEKKTLFRLAQNELALEDYKLTKQYLDRALKNYPKEGAVYLLGLEYYYRQRDGVGFQQLLSQMQHASLVLSQQEQEQISFWRSQSA